MLNQIFINKVLDFHVPTHRAQAIKQLIKTELDKIQPQLKATSYYKWRSSPWFWFSAIFFLLILPYIVFMNLKKEYTEIIKEHVDLRSVYVEIINEKLQTNYKTLKKVYASSSSAKYLMTHRPHGIPHDATIEDLTCYNLYRGDDEKDFAKLHSFYYRWTRSNGKSSQTYIRKSVAVTGPNSNPLLDFPLVITRENTITKLGEKFFGFNKQHVNLEDSTFEKKFLLKNDNPKRIREILEPTNMNFLDINFEQNLNYSFLFETNSSKRFIFIGVKCTNSSDLWDISNTTADEQILIDNLYELLQRDVYASRGFWTLLAGLNNL